MKNKIIGFVSVTILLLLVCSGIFADFVRFMCWLFLLQNSSPDISTAGAIIVRVLTFLVSYTLVGVLFSFFGWFNSKVMSFVYMIFSTLIGFILAYIVWIIEKYIFIIGIVLGVVLVCAIVILIIAVIHGKKESKTKK